MTHLLDLLQGPVWQHVVVVLAHSVWQAAVAAAIAALALARLPASNPHVRYRVSLCALIAIVLACFVTYAVIDWRATTPNAVTAPLVADQTNRARADNARISPDGAAGESFLARTEAKSDPAVGATSAASATARTAPAWVPVCAALWIVGATLMFVRAAWLVTGAQRLARGRPLADARIVSLVASLRARFGIRRAIAVIDSGAIGPAVLGIVRPTLLLPAALLCDLPLDTLEAIVAHELAHIRRHDYLVNLVQMLVEAALFFNPAVWWISRQIRREREACCDVMGADATGDALAYAAALAVWAERLRATRPARVDHVNTEPQRMGGATAALVSFAGNEGQADRGGSLLDRVQRLLVAGYRPELRASWRALAISLCVSLIGLAALLRGTQAGVALAAEILSPAERVEQLSQERDRVRPIINADPDRIVAKLIGTITTADGQPVPKNTQAELVSRLGNNSHASTVDLQLPNFNLKTRAGRNWVIIFSEGYAPAIFGPVTIKPGDMIEDIKIVLERGFSGQLKVADEQGQPIPNARAKGMLTDVGMGVRMDWRGDNAGIIAIDHLSHDAMDFTVSAPGYQSHRQDNVRLDSVEGTNSMTIVLVRAQPTTGMVVSTASEPIAGAKIRAAIAAAPASADPSGENAPVLATTGADGRFTLESLNDDGIYAMLVEAESHGRRVFMPVTSGERDLRWTLGPDITLRGRIVGDLRKLKKVGRRTLIDAHQRFTLLAHENSSHGGLLHQSATVNIQNDEGRFELRNLIPGKVSITAGEHTKEFALEEGPNEVTIDLDEVQPAPELVPMRHVVIRFIGPDEKVFPTGTVRLYSSAAEGSTAPAIWKDVAIQQGNVEIDAHAPGAMHCEIKNVVGYWFQSFTFQVPTGEGNFEQDCPVVAAGAVRGRVLNPDGSPAAGRHVYVGTRGEVRPKPGVHEIFNVLENIEVDQQGEFFLSPLPLGLEYVIRASRGYENAYSAPVQLDNQHVAPRVDIRFSETKIAGGRIVGPDGQPRARWNVSLDFRSPNRAGTGYLPATVTDSAGRFHFDGLSTDVGEYWAILEMNTQPPKPSAKLNLGGPDVEIRLSE